MTSNTEPKKHHYIPQFILRNFCFDDKNHLLYYDVQNESVCVKETKDIFMSPFLYMDEKNNPEDRMKIEHDFAEYEREVSKLINGKLSNEDAVAISEEEDDKLKLFFALMGFRSKRTSEVFSVNTSTVNKPVFSLYQKDGDYSDLWKRNLGQLVNCRSLKEVRNNPQIDDMIKAFMRRDTYGYFGRHFSLVECQEPYEFIISDCYPTEIKGDIGIIYDIFPLSPQRALLSVCNGAEGTPLDVRVLRERAFMQPNPAHDGRKRIISTKLNEKEIIHINTMIAKEAEIGIAAKTETALNKSGIQIENSAESAQIG